MKDPGILRPGSPLKVEAVRGTGESEEVGGGGVELAKRLAKDFFGDEEGGTEMFSPHHGVADAPRAVTWVTWSRSRPSDTWRELSSFFPNDPLGGLLYIGEVSGPKRKQFEFKKPNREIFFSWAEIGNSLNHPSLSFQFFLGPKYIIPAVRNESPDHIYPMLVKTKFPLNFNQGKPIQRIITLEHVKFHN